MAVPISFPSTTARFGLPLLFSGQAQKEFSINQAFAMVDSLLQSSILESVDTPPPSPTEGDCYRVVAPATGDWLDHEDDIAVSLGGAWQFVRPQPGMRVYDVAEGAILHYESEWKRAEEPALPSGGSVIDAEARQAIAELMEALRKIGVFPESV